MAKKKKQRRGFFRRGGPGGGGGGASRAITRVIEVPRAAPPLVVAAPRPRFAYRRGSNSPIGNVIAVAAGGVIGAGAAGLLYRAGMSPYTVGTVIGTAGGVGMAVLRGKARWASAGIAAAGAGQIALTYLSRRTAQQAQGQQARPPGGRQAIDASDVIEAFNQARQAAAFSAEQLAQQQAAAAQAAQYQAAAQAAGMGAAMGGMG
jgi:hypothetical protein